MSTEPQTTACGRGPDCPKCKGEETTLDSAGASYMPKLFEARPFIGAPESKIVDCEPYVPMFPEPEASTDAERPRPVDKDVERTILQEAIEVTGSHRPAEYGHPLDHFAKTIGAVNSLFTEVVKRRLAEGKPMFEPEDWPKFLIIDKVSRSVEAYKRDNMVDVAGYAQTHEWVIEERERRG